MKLLNVNEITRVICETNMGALKLRIRKGMNDYFFTLDSVELPKELNKQLAAHLFADKPESKGITKEESEKMISKGRYTEVKTFLDETLPKKKPVGRPKKVTTRVIYSGGSGKPRTDEDMDKSALDE